MARSRWSLLAAKSDKLLVPQMKVCYPGCESEIKV
jgi:hypothetical protein